MNEDIEQIPEEFDPTPAIAIGQHLADLQMDVAEASYNTALETGFANLIENRVCDEALSRFTGEQLALFEYNAQIEFIHRWFKATAAISALPLLAALILGFGAYSFLVLTPSGLLSLWMAIKRSS